MKKIAQSFFLKALSNIGVTRKLESIQSDTILSFIYVIK